MTPDLPCLGRRLLSCWAAAAARLRAFVRAERGNVAMIVALMLVPMSIAAGAGVDFARAMMVRSELADALDSAGLAVGGAQSLSASALQSLAQSYFDANYNADSSFGTPTLTVTKSTSQVMLTASVEMPTTLMNVAGIKSLPVSFTSTVVWGQTKLWVALVLDNTGSMTETDSTGTSKISALKTASHDLLDMLQGASATAGDVMVSIVPFTRDVSVKNLTFSGSSYYDASWIDWSLYGSCNIYGISDQATCTSTYGTWYSHHHSGYCSISGYYSSLSCQSATGTWTTGTKSSWNGCITDRTQDYDTDVTTPTASDSATLFPAEQYSNCPLAMLPLTDDWTALGNEVDNMYAGGNTNQTIGFVWGWQSLTDGDPLNPGTLPSETQQVIILLSDGLNTQDRWYTNQADIDAREKLACDNAKAKGITIYTVYVDLNGTTGSSTALEYCASDSSKYFDLTSANDIVTAFKTIGTQITNLRVAK